MFPEKLLQLYKTFLSLHLASSKHITVMKKLQYVLHIISISSFILILIQAIENIFSFLPHIKAESANMNT